MNWDLLDYLAAAILIGGALAAIFVVTLLTKKKSHRVAATAVLGLAVGLVWMELAVGLFD